MNRYFDRLTAMRVPLELVLIAHDEGACTVPDEMRPRARFIGPVERRTEATPVSSAASLDRPLVVISGGGGGYPGTVDFYNLALAGFERARQHTPELAALLVAGPLFTEWRQLRLVDRVRVLPFDPHLSDLFASADVIVCQAGYNTVAEVLSSGVPTICVPAPRGADDQFERAALAATSPTFRTYEGADPIAFGQLLLDAIAAGRTASSPRPVMPGAARAAEHLLGLLAR
jgi:predicted glycosyltransferase